MPCPADACHCQLEAANIQHIERDVVALACLAEQILFRNFAILQYQRTRRRAVNPQLVFLGAHDQARRFAFDQKC